MKKIEARKWQRNKEVQFVISMNGLGRVPSIELAIDAVV